jgi:hypothetical protein
MSAATVHVRLDPEAGLVVSLAGARVASYFVTASELTHIKLRRRSSPCALPTARSDRSATDGFGLIGATTGAKIARTFAAASRRISGRRRPG